MFLLKNDDVLIQYIRYRENKRFHFTHDYLEANTDSSISTLTNIFYSNAIQAILLNDSHQYKSTINQYAMKCKDICKDLLSSSVKNTFTVTRRIDIYFILHLPILQYSHGLLLEKTNFHSDYHTTLLQGLFSCQL